MALNTTPGDASQDSFGTLAEAEAFHAVRTPPSPGWLAALGNDAKKEGALKMATTYLSAIPRGWTGAAVDATQAQAWPRSGMTSRNGFAIATAGAASMPGDLKRAQFELAGQLLDDDRTGDDTTLSGITAVDIDGAVSVEYDKRYGERVALQRRDSLETFIPDQVILMLVPSWLKDVREEDYASQFVVDSLEN